VSMQVDDHGASAVKCEPSCFRERLSRAAEPG